MPEVILESLKGYQDYVSSPEGSGRHRFWTTSPFLLNRLRKMGEDVHSLEENVDRAEIDALAVATYGVGNSVTAHLDRVSPWREFIGFEGIYAGQFQRYLYTLLYKAHLLDRLMRHADGPCLCVGSEAQPPAGLDLSHEFFATLFPSIAARFKSDDVRCFPSRLSEEVQNEVKKFVWYRKLAKGEKLLSLLNNTPSSFVYKIYRNIREKGLWPFREIRLVPTARRDFAIYRDCELIDEMFLALLVQGGAVRHFDLPRVPVVPDPEESRAVEEDPLSPQIRDLAMRGLREAGVEWSETYAPCVDMGCDVLLRVVRRIRLARSPLVAAFDRTLSGFRPGTLIVTNAYTSARDRLFCLYAEAKGFPSAVVEHGITIGLSEYSRYRSQHVGMAGGYAGIYHSDLSRGVMEELRPEQKKLVFGLPRVMARVILPGVQRRLARRLLGVGPDEELVVYVADLERNNVMFGPCIDTDLDFVEKTKAIVRDMAREHPDARICLKLYPTTRYIDRYCFEDLAEEMEGLFIPEDVEFRFIRAAADHIYVSSFFSTLGWVLGSGKPYTFVKVPWSPVRFGSRQKAGGETESRIRGGLDLDFPVHSPHAMVQELFSL